MSSRISHGLVFKALVIGTMGASMTACVENSSNNEIPPVSAPTPAPTSTPTATPAPPELTTTAPPVTPPAVGASDLTQVGSAVQVTARSQDLTFTTAAIAGETKVRVTLPSGYDPNGARRYPVIYLLHGGVSNYTTWTAANGGDLEALTPNTQAIFVMPDAAGNPPVGVGNYVDWFNQGSLGPPKIETYHMRQLLPWIDQHYKTVATRNARATAGFSMGGHGSFQYARHFPDLIGISASFSGAIDNTQPALDWRTGGAAIAKNIWGDYETQEVRWRASGTVDEAKNLSNTNLFISYGDTGNPEGSYIRLGAEAVQDRLKMFNIPFVAQKYTGAAHTWSTAKRGFSEWLPEAMSLLANPVKQRQANPSEFSFTTIDADYEIYGWNVGIARKALEFSSLEVADRNAFSIIGSGNATVQTPPIAQANTIYRVNLSGGSPSYNKTIYVKSDANGRAVIPVVLGPANPFQQFTAEADAGSTAAGPDAGSVPFTVRGSGSRFYTVKVTLSPYAP